MVLETNPNLFASKVLSDSFVVSVSYCAENWRICLLSSVFFIPFCSHCPTFLLNAFQNNSVSLSTVCISNTDCLWKFYVTQGKMQATKSNDEGSVLPTLKMCYIWWWGKGQRDLRQNLRRGTSHFHRLPWKITYGLNIYSQATDLFLVTPQQLN